MGSLVWVFIRVAISFVCLCASVYYGPVNGDYSRATFNLVLGVWLLGTYVDQGDL